MHAFARLHLVKRARLSFSVTMNIGSVQQEVQVKGDTVSAIETETPSINAVYNA